MTSEPFVPVSSPALPMRIEALVKSFGELKAVNGITLEVHGG